MENLVNIQTTPAVPQRRAGQISPAKLAHIVLRTPRYDEMIAWYLKVLDATLAFGSPMISFITYDEEHHRVAFVNMPQLADCDPMAAGLDHVAFTYGSLSDLIATYERLKADGIEPGWCINHGPTTSMYFRDPDGNQVELQIDNFETEAALGEWFASGVFQSNPIGVEFDPGVLAAKLKAGTSIAELVMQGSTAQS
jgi:catechol-2,3-dioxygenase